MSFASAARNIPYLLTAVDNACGIDIYVAQTDRA
jgi:hypothetical protein